MVGCFSHTSIGYQTYANVPCVSTPSMYQNHTSLIGDQHGFSTQSIKLWIKLLSSCIYYLSLFCQPCIECKVCLKIASSINALQVKVEHKINH